MEQIICSGWLIWKTSLRLEAVEKFTQLISICSTVNKGLQCIHNGESSSCSKSGLSTYDLF